MILLKLKGFKSKMVCISQRAFFSVRLSQISKVHCCVSGVPSRRSIQSYKKYIYTEVLRVNMPFTVRLIYI